MDNTLPLSIYYCDVMMAAGNSDDIFRHALHILLPLFVLVLFIKLGSWGVIETSEARYAEISKEMYESKDFTHPRMLGILHYHKPPVIYWITSLAYLLFGVNEFAARFFLQLAYILQVILVYRLALLIFEDKKTSLYSAIIYATLPLVLISVRGLTTDAYVNTIILASVLTWLTFVKHLRVKYLYFTSILLGIGFLTKGPVPWIYTGSVIIGTITLINKHRKFWHHYLIAMLILLPLSLSWYLIVINENKLLINYFLFHHTVERFTNASSFKRAEPWWFYLAILPGIILVWLPVLISGTIKQKFSTAPVLIKRILIFWVVLPFIFFSMASSKLALYILPLTGGVALVAGHYLSSQSWSRKFEYVFLFMVLFINIILLSAVFYQRGFLLPYWSCIFPVISITAVVSLWFAGWLAVTERMCLYAVIFTFTLVPFASVFMAFNPLQVNAITPVTNYLKKERLSDKTLLIYDELLPSVAFELDHPDIISLYNGTKRAEREIQFEPNHDWQKRWVDLTKQPKKTVNTADTVLLIKKKKVKRAEWLLSSYGKHQAIGDWLIYFN